MLNLPRTRPRQQKEEFFQTIVFVGTAVKQAVAFLVKVGGGYPGKKPADIAGLLTWKGELHDVARSAYSAAIILLNLEKPSLGGGSGGQEGV